MQELAAFAQEDTRFLISAEAVRQGKTADLCYRIHGPIQDLVLAPRKNSREFKDELWKTTCFEIFMRDAGDKDYVEWNFSPSGDWAYYEFGGYREPKANAARKQPGPWSIEVGPTTLLYRVQLELPTGSDLPLSLTCILQTRDERKSYWALAHCRPQPDFHAPESFVGRI